MYWYRGMRGESSATEDEELTGDDNEFEQNELSETERAEASRQREVMPGTLPGEEHTEASGQVPDAQSQNGVDNSLSDLDKRTEEDHENEGFIAGAVAGASALAAAAVATVMGDQENSQKVKDEEKTSTRSAGSAKEISPTDYGYDAEIRTSKRISVSSPPSPVEMVRATSGSHKDRTGSHTSPSPLRKKSDTEKVRNEVVEEKSIAKDFDPEMIGVATTTDLPTPAPRTPSPDITRGGRASPLIASGILEQMQGQRRVSRASVSPPQARNADASNAAPAESSPSSSSRPSSVPDRTTSLTPAAQATAGANASELSGASPKVAESSLVVQKDAFNAKRSSTDTSSSSRSNKPKGPPLQTNLNEPQQIKRHSFSNASGRHRASGSESSVQQRTIDSRAPTEYRQRDFDNLVKSDETVKYTLTPQNMREIEV